MSEPTVEMQAIYSRFWWEIRTSYTGNWIPIDTMPTGTNLRILEMMQENVATSRNDQNSPTNQDRI